MLKRLVNIHVGKGNGGGISNLQRTVSPEIPSKSKASGIFAKKRNTANVSEE